MQETVKDTSSMAVQQTGNTSFWGVTGSFLVKYIFPFTSTIHLGEETVDYFARDGDKPLGSSAAMVGSLLLSAISDAAYVLGGGRYFKGRGVFRPAIEDIRAIRGGMRQEHLTQLRERGFIEIGGGGNQTKPKMLNKVLDKVDKVKEKATKPMKNLAKKLEENERPTSATKNFLNMRKAKFEAQTNRNVAAITPYGEVKNKGFHGKVISVTSKVTEYGVSIPPFFYALVQDVLRYGKYYGKEGIKFLHTSGKKMSESQLYGVVKDYTKTTLRIPLDNPRATVTGIGARVIGNRVAEVEKEKYKEKKEKEKREGELSKQSYIQQKPPSSGEDKSQQSSTPQPQSNKEDDHGKLKEILDAIKKTTNKN